MKLWVFMKPAVSVILSAAIICTACKPSETFSAQQIFVEYQHYDVSRLEEVLSQFEEELKKDNNDDGVTQSFNSIVDQKNILQTQKQLAYVNYMSDMSQSNKDEYDYMCNTRTECTDKIYKVLNSALDTKYDTLISKMLGNIYSDVKEYNTDNGQQKKITMAEQQVKNEYYDLINDNTIGSLDQSCAALYLKSARALNEAVKPYGCNYFEYMYKNVYNRDYTVHDIEKLSPYVKSIVIDEFIKVCHAWGDATLNINDDPRTNVYDNNFEVIKNISPKLSPELYESAQFILDNKLYKFGAGKNSSQMGFTTSLRQYNTQFIYQYLYNDKTDIATSIHEFGHFNAMRYHDISSIDDYESNMDIAEVQSQGLSVIFTEYYDDIYGKSAEKYRLSQYRDLLKSIKEGFMINEFESYVFSNADNITSEDVFNKYISLCNQYSIFDASISGVHHLFDCPAYYISYATSAMAAVKLWDVLDCSADDAMDMYTKFSHVDGMDSDIKYKDSLEKTGFGNVLSTEYIKQLPDITDRILYGGIYGDIDNNKIINSRDIILLQTHILDTATLFSDKENRKYDLDKDSSVNAADLCRMIDLFVSK